MEMKLITFSLFTILLIFPISKTRGQNIVRNDKSILKDSLWINQEIWKEARNQGIPLKEQEAKNVDFYCIPVGTYNVKILEYSYLMDFRSILVEDKKRAAGLISYNNLIFGYLIAYQKDRRWRSAPVRIFRMNSPIKTAIGSVLSNPNNKIFFLSPLEAICYSDCKNTFIFDNTYQKFVKIEEFIKQRNELEAMRDYYKRYLE